MLARRYEAIATTLFAVTCFAQTAHAQSTTSCTDDQKGIVASAQVTTGFELLGAGDYISAMRNGGDSARFIKWFGSTDSAIVDRVEQTLEGVWHGIDEITYNCSCTRADAYAFVNPDDATFQIFMCPPYFSSFAAGNMQMSTVIHEVSHFLGTRDCTKPISGGECCYNDPSDPPGCMGADPVPNSPAAAQTLASTDSDTASRNAYNIAWFVTDGS